ncbi:uncharacterized protein BKA78DRAFT_315339 [Phyllosticta capitalensis]|uniref:uncharacterized protein n=1 Tax=Phyllosticta capitalensis TaxID=121624 RepID=UPI003131FCB4
MRDLLLPDALRGGRMQTDSESFPPPMNCLALVFPAPRSGKYRSRRKIVDAAAESSKCFVTKCSFQTHESHSSLWCRKGHTIEGDPRIGIDISMTNVRCENKSDQRQKAFHCSCCGILTKNSRLLEQNEPTYHSLAIESWIHPSKLGVSVAWSWTQMHEE